VADRLLTTERHWVLGIDTASDMVSLALVPTAPESVAGAELAWPAGRNQTVTLMLQIDRLLRLCDIESDALGAIAVTTGPGGFNALRVGMSVAKGFAFALGVPVFGVGTLDLAAAAFTGWKLPVRAFVAAGRGRVVCGDYVPVRGRLQLHGELAHRTPLQLADGLLRPTVLAGDVSVAEAEALRAQANVVLPDPALRRRRAAVLVDLIVPRWAAGDADDLTALEPLYLHRQQEVEDVAERTQVATGTGTDAGAGAGSGTRA
jgi:tRNA threonylcarbamoyladenosine biosynthesis protein TsaB